MRITQKTLHIIVSIDEIMPTSTLYLITLWLKKLCHLLYTVKSARSALFMYDFLCMRFLVVSVFNWMAFERFQVSVLFLS